MADTATLPVALRRLAEQVRPVALAGQQVLPVLPALAGLLPDGALRRGSTVAVGAAGGGASGATSLAPALCAGASEAGSWVAAVGHPALGPVAAAEAGVALERLLLVADPAAAWPAVVAALVDALDLVLVRPEGRRGTDVRRIAARQRERGAVVVVVGPASAWPGPVDVHLTVEAARWEGLEPGHGRLSARRIEVVAGGRGAAARPRRASLWLPAADGGVRPAGAGGGVDGVDRVDDGRGDPVAPVALREVG